MNIEIEARILEAARQIVLELGHQPSQVKYLHAAENKIRREVEFALTFHGIDPTFTRTGQ